MDTKFFDLPTTFCQPTSIKLTIADTQSDLMKKLNLIDRKLDKLLRKEKQAKKVKKDGYEVV